MFLIVHASFYNAMSYYTLYEIIILNVAFNIILYLCKQNVLHRAIKKLIDEVIM